MIRPIRRNVLLELLDDNEDWSREIVKPDHMKKSFSGMLKVLSKSNDCMEPISIGDKVIIEYSEEDIKEFSREEDGKQTFLVREGLVMCIVEEEPRP